MSHPLPPLPFSVAPSASKLEEVPEKIPLQDKTEFQEVEVDMQLAGVVHESDDEEDFDLPPEVDVRKKKSKLTEYQVSHSLPSHTNRHTCTCASAHTPLPDFYQLQTPTSTLSLYPVELLPSPPPPLQEVTMDLPWDDEAEAAKLHGFDLVEGADEARECESVVALVQ